ncbi:MAG: DeoR/GlpR transcriptional regulator [Firmicutes bacterium]|nr:DeoR/GlpR transcriptional regulator [Bacillota bacterium]
MLKKERQDHILRMVQEQDMVKIKDLTALFDASVITIRRDLDELESRGLIKKVYGGAVLVKQKEQARVQPFFVTRIGRHHEEKRKIGIAAAEMVRENETIMLDIGTTALEIAKALKNRENITVLTSSLPVLNELAGSRLSVFSLGGQLRGNELALCGGLALNAINEFCIDKAFVGAGGITLKNGITDYNRESAELCSAVVQRAAETIVVTDSSKFGRDASSVIGLLSSVDVVMTDSGIPEEYRCALNDMGVKLIIVDG